MKWIASDYWEMIKRSLRHIRHDPEQLTNVTLQPVLMVVLMKFVLGGAISTGFADGSYIDFVLPGIFIVAAAFAAISTTTSVAVDLQDGVTDRSAVEPMRTDPLDRCRHTLEADRKILDTRSRKSAVDHGSE